MLLPLHIKPDDYSVVACARRNVLHYEAASINPKGFRSPRTSRLRSRSEIPYRADFMARLASLSGKERIADIALRHGTGLPVRRAVEELA